MGAFKSTFTAVALFLSVFAYISEAGPGVIRFCDTRGQQYSVSSRDCPGGTLINPKYLGDAAENGHMWNCICTTGSWYIYRKICNNPNVHFTAGEVTCFNPSDVADANSPMNSATAEVLGAVYIGDPENRNQESSPLLWTSISGLLVRDDGLNRTWQIGRYKGGLSAIRLNPVGDWTVREEISRRKMCLTAPDDSQHIGIFKYSLEKFYGDGNKDAKFSFIKDCGEQDEFTVLDSVQPQLIDSNSMLVRPNNGQSKMSEECKACFGSGMGNDDDDDGSATESCVPGDLSDIDGLQQEVDLQTSRMGLYWAKNMLDINHIDTSYEYIRDDLQEVQILTKAAIIAFGACNMNYIPKEFYQYFLMMFKQLLSEAFNKYAPKEAIPEDKLTIIFDALKKCQERTKPYIFEVSKTCPGRYEKVSKNGTLQEISIADKDKANPEKHDILLEFIWKLKTFMHYHCFEEFAEQSFLHDLVQQSIEAVFTEDLLLRWSNPSYAIRMYEHIFRTHFDINATMYNFDACVTVAHSDSKFKVSLKRPIDQPNRQKRSIRRKRIDVDTDTNTGTGTAAGTNNALTEEEDGPLIDFPDPLPGVDLTDLFYNLYNKTFHCAKDVNFAIEFLKPDLTECW